MRQGVWCVPVERSAGAADGDVCRSVRSVCSVQCSQRWAFTVERSARVAEGDVRRSVRRLQRWACTAERSACVAEGDVRRSVRSTFLLGGVTYGR